MKGSQSLAPTQSEYKIPKSCPFPSSSILVLQCALNALANREESAGPGRPGEGPVESWSHSCEQCLCSRASANMNPDSLD